MATFLFLVFLVLFLGIAYLLRAPILRELGSWWVVSEEPAKGEVIIVCAGDNPYGERVRKAVELYRAGWAGRVLLSGALYRTYLPEVDLMRREAINQGVPEGRVLTLSSGAAGTAEEIRQMEALLKQHGWKRVLLVASNYHTRRVRLLARKILGPSGIEFQVIAAPDSEFPLDHWWRTRGGPRLFWQEFQELVWAHLR
jgi:uncharacterized SAM-binding protein YcdF (DUF218 family)